MCAREFICAALDDFLANTVVLRDSLFEIFEWRPGLFSNTYYGVYAFALVCNRYILPARERSESWNINVTSGERRYASIFGTAQFVCKFVDSGIPTFFLLLSFSTTRRLRRPVYYRSYIIMFRRRRITSGSFAPCCCTARKVGLLSTWQVRRTNCDLIDCISRERNLYCSAVLYLVIIAYVAAE